MKKTAAKKPSKQAITVVIVLAAVILVVGIKYFKWRQGGPGQVVAARVFGRPDALVRLTEWVDFQCPSCAAGAVDLKKYMKTYPDKFYVEVKYFPLGGHLHSLEAAKFAECSARQGKFWPFYDLVFERQPQWRDLFDAHPVFEQIVQDIGLDQKKIDACVATDEIREIVLKEKDQGQALAVQSTPTYFINGKMVVGPKDMRDEVNKLLAPALAPPPMSQSPAAGG
jgi:protein-disulfide isomerase